MVDYKEEAYVGIDVAKLKNAVAIAEGGRDGEVRYLGEFEASATSMARLVTRIAAKYERVHFCYEAGPTGYGLYRLISELGHRCTVVGPSLIPRKPGDRVKTNRRDATGLARLLRAGELTAVWVPDPGHEAMRDLVRARTAAVEALKTMPATGRRIFIAAWSALPGQVDLGCSVSAVGAVATLRPPGTADCSP